MPPATASARVHAAELFTTGASGASHLWHRNVDRRLFFLLAPAGVVGAIVGAYVLTGIDGAVVRPDIVAYLGLMGALILYRTFRSLPERRLKAKLVVPLGGIGGFVDTVGGAGGGRSSPAR